MQWFQADAEVADADGRLAEEHAAAEAALAAAEDRRRLWRSRNPGIGCMWGVAERLSYLG